MAKTKKAKNGEMSALVDARIPIRPPIPKPKKERPASKGRVHKGRTRH